jgi:hypothetical protein
MPSQLPADILTQTGAHKAGISPSLLDRDSVTPLSAPRRGDRPPERSKADALRRSHLAVNDYRCPAPSFIPRRSQPATPEANVGVPG